MSDQYRIVTAETFGELEIAINRLIAEGWSCQGGPVIADDDLGDNLAQAMVLVDSDVPRQGTG